MTSPKVGDRVRVEFDARVVDSGYVDEGWVRVLLSDDHLYSPIVPVYAITVVAPPLKVGDRVVDRAQLDDLPPGSIVCRAGIGMLPAYKNKTGKWKLGTIAVDAAQIAGWLEVTVLRVGASL